MIKAVLFDFDDTLVDTLGSKIQALQEMAREVYEFQLAEETIRTHWGKPYRELLFLLYQEYSHDIEEIVTHYERIRLAYLSRLFDGAKEALLELSTCVKIGIVTAAGRKVVYEDLEIIDLSPDLFFYIQTADDTPVHKPNPDVFKPILEKLLKFNISKDQVVYVGDSMTDYAAAKGAGLQFYGIPGNTTPKKEFEKYGVPTIENLRTLLKTVQCQNV